VRLRPLHILGQADHTRLLVCRLTSSCFSQLSEVPPQALLGRLSPHSLWNLACGLYPVTFAIINRERMDAKADGTDFKFARDRFRL
jgi:hypothetical protein